MKFPPSERRLVRKQRIEEREVRVACARMNDQSGGLVLLGANTVKGEPERHYSGNGASVGASATPDDAVGVMTSIGPGHARVEFPYPVQESTFDVIELKR